MNTQTIARINGLDLVLKTSPNYFNIARPITVNAKLVTG
jgi:hypothetical protein